MQIAQADVVVQKIAFSPNKANGEVVADFIKDSKKSLDVAAYSLTSATIGDALKTAKKRLGKSFRLLCDKQQSQIKSALCTSIGGSIDKKSGLMHNKFIVRDNECVLTGSFNFTNNAIYPNRENFIIICDKEVAEAYSKEFNLLWKNNR